ncbi:thyrotropin-releasing hormone receptor-like [Haliotis asinina]|uniref:thyrotropin-releasing hormone receptor-like n=1 Tax=Haliotis asinina TaxID=109174 RepID=UPI0035323C3E
MRTLFISTLFLLLVDWCLAFDIGESTSSTMTTNQSTIPSTLIPRTNTTGIAVGMKTIRTSTASKAPERINTLVTAVATRRTTYVINLILKPIVCISGFVMNVIGCCVLLHKSLRHSSYRYLLGLLIADCGFLFCGILHMPTHITREYDVVYSSYFSSVLVIPVWQYLERAFSKVSCYIICILALERLLAISFPLKVKTLVLVRHSGKITAALFVVIFIMHIPRIFLIRFVWRLNRQFNLSMYVREQITYDGPLQSFMTIYINFVLKVIMTYIPPFLLLVLNICIWIQLSLIRNRRKCLFGTVSDEQWKVTLTLLIISTFFLTVYIPLIAVNILETEDPIRFARGGTERNFRELLSSISSFGWAINSGNDFIIYIVTNVKFRATFKKMFCCRKQPLHVTKSTATSSSGSHSRRYDASQTNMETFTVTMTGPHK